MTTEILLRLLLAALWGGLVGLEREFRSKSAGFRTMILISMGACFFTLLGESIGGTGSGDRIASNVVTGIGFIGGGVIFQSENRVNGITTAATIWAVASVGMGIGAGFYLTSAFASVLILVVLGLLPVAETWVEGFMFLRVFTLRHRLDMLPQEQLKALFARHRMKGKLQKYTYKDQWVTSVWEVRGSRDRHRELLASLEANPAIDHLEFT